MYLGEKKYSHYQCGIWTNIMKIAQPLRKNAIMSVHFKFGVTTSMTFAQIVSQGS